MHAEKTPLAYSAVIGADHAGFKLAQEMVAYWRTCGENPLDVGTYSTDSVDYPDFAGKVSKAIQKGQCEQGLLVCSSGIGMAIAANRFEGIRAVWADRVELIQPARQHNNANVLCVGSSWTNIDQLIALWQTFITTPFDGGERHSRRVGLMDKI